jgi:hypothetical protein
MVVGMKRAESLVVLNRESKSLCDSLYGEVAELLNILSIHDYEFFR